MKKFLLRVAVCLGIWAGKGFVDLAIGSVFGWSPVLCAGTIIVVTVLAIILAVKACKSIQ